MQVNLKCNTDCLYCQDDLSCINARVNKVGIEIENLNYNALATCSEYNPRDNEE